MKARSFLETAIEALATRGREYEAGQEENSMAEIVELHGKLIVDSGWGGLDELEGWFFMLALKLVRLRKSIQQGKASKDSIVDLLGYTAKMGECLFADEDEPELTLAMMDEAVKAAEQVAIKPVMRDGALVYDIPPSPLLAEQDCLHISCTMKDIEDRLVIVCDDCPKQFTAKEFVDNECEAR